MAQPLKNFISKDRIRALREHRVAQVMARLFQIGLVGLVFYILIDTLEDQNWAEIRDALPTNPLYYVFFLLWYFAIPATELIVYRIMWGFSLLPYASVFLRKRVYNLALVSYSGEAYLAFWARKRFGLTDKKIFATVKDSSVLSALSSNLFTIGLLVIFFATGQWEMLIKADQDFMFYVGLALVVGLILVPVILRFRKSIISLSSEVALRVMLVHFLRFLAMMACQIGMWAVVLPHVPISTWLLFITAQLVLTRVPLLPNTDLLFLALGIAMAPMLNAPSETVSSMFLAAGILAQVLNLAIYFITSFQNGRPRGKVDANRNGPAQAHGEELGKAAE